MISETDKYLKWYKQEIIKEGLKDVRFFPGNTDEVTQEEFFREANLIVSLAKENRTIDDTDII